MSARARALAEQFEQANDELIALVERLPDARWLEPGGSESWSAGVTAHHIATDHAILAGFVETVASGQPLPGWTIEMLHQYNAQHAEEHSACDKAETLELLRREGATAASMVRGLSDEQLDLTASIPWEGGRTVSTQQLIEEKLIGHIHEHSPSIQVTT